VWENGQRPGVYEAGGMGNQLFILFPVPRSLSFPSTIHFLLSTLPLPASAR